MVACADMTPPAAITTLRAGQAQGDSVKLTWTPPADAVGTEIRCSQSLAAIQAGGGFSAFVRSRGNGWAWVTVPTPGTWWRYAVITRDAAGNWSKPSNVASAYAAPIAVIVALGALAAAAGAAVVATRRRVPPQA
jgi:hypothetical protein